MTTLSFEARRKYQDDKVVVEVRFSSVPLLTARMVLDTGATISTLHHSWLPLLGIADVSTGEQGSIEVAGGQVETCWIHPVDVVVFGRALTIEVAFCPAWDMKDLLGMRGFMDQVIFALNHADHELFVSWR